MIDYCGLHVHSDYSLRDGFCSVRSIVKHCKQKEYSACCITDHGSLGGAIELHSECKKNNIKPIIGCEFYVVDDRSKIKESKREHIVLLAKDLQGFHNLITINNDAVINGFYKRPITEYDFIFKHSGGVICLTACAGGRASQLAIKNDINGLCCFLKEMKDVFKDDLYVELMLIDFIYKDKDLNISVSQQDINKRLVLAAKKVGVKTIITNDSHYIKKEDVQVHDFVLMLSSNKTMKDKVSGKAWSFDVRDLYYKDIDDIYSDYDNRFTESFSEDVLEDSLDNIEFLINSVQHYKMDNSFKCPRFSTDKDDVLNKVIDICIKKLEKIGQSNNKAYIDRLNIELDLLYEKGFLDYFLIVKDILDFARNIDPLSVGPGRGSCSGSLVAYLMDIVSVDCIQWGLKFERFLNRQRSDSPDIDSDISPQYRDAVKEYIFKKYPGKSCSIGTYGKMRFKSTLLDVCRIFDIPVNQIFAVTKKLPPDIDDFSFDEAKNNFKFLADFLEKHKKKDIERYFKSLYGSIRNVSKHAAGVVICNKPIHNQIPLVRSGEHLVSAWSDGKNKELSSLGFLKMDVLGLSAIKILADTVHLIKRVHNININLDNIGLECRKTFATINNLSLCGVFQFDTPISIQQIKRLKPKSIIELSNITAMIRPGPLRMGMDKTYLYNMKNRYDSACEDVDRILKPTYGVMLYQEQIMDIVQAIGGFTLGEADEVRRLLIKASKGSVKKAESNKTVIEVKSRFLNNASKRINKNKAIQLWNLMLSFAGYGFNLSHSIPYTLIGYREAWLKTHYPLEFYCSLLNNVDTMKETKNGNSKIKNIAREMKQAGIRLYLPDVNVCENDFSVYNGGIMFGLSNIKGIVKASNNLIKNRPYNNFEDIQNKNMKRVVNKRVVSALMGSGALNNLVKDKSTPITESEFLGMPVTQVNNGSVKNQSLSCINNKSGRFSGTLLSVEEFKTKKNNDLMAILNFEEIDEKVLVWASDYFDLKTYLKKKIGICFDFGIKTFKDAYVFIK